jgi:hypothetical protein
MGAFFVEASFSIGLVLSFFAIDSAAVEVVHRVYRFLETFILEEVDKCEAAGFIIRLFCDDINFFYFSVFGKILRQSF